MPTIRLWLTWFLQHSIPALYMECHSFISDHEKGMAISVPAVCGQPIHIHCRQPIAKSLQQRYGNKVRPLFWRACRAKIKKQLHEKKRKRVKYRVHHLSIISVVSRRRLGFGPIQPTLDMAIKFFFVRYTLFTNSSNNGRNLLRGYEISL
jgi:hypothetical protein